MPKIKSPREGKEGLKRGAAHLLAAPPGQGLQSQPGHVCFANRVRRDELVTLGFLDSLAQRFVSSLVCFCNSHPPSCLAPVPAVYISRTLRSLSQPTTACSAELSWMSAPARDAMGSHKGCPFVRNCMPSCSEREAVVLGM